MATLNGGPKAAESYTEGEVLAISKSYLAVTTEPIVGAEQKAKTYKNRTFKGYLECKSVDAFVCPFLSVETRAKAILTYFTLSAGAARASKL